MNDLVAGLSAYIDCERLDLNTKLISSAFAKVKNTLDAVVAKCAEKGLGVVKSKDFITEEQEELLWQKGFLREKDPDMLHCTIHYLCGSRFGLHEGKEHRALSRWPECQITVEQINGKNTLV